MIRESKGTLIRVLEMDRSKEVCRAYAIPDLNLVLEGTGPTKGYRFMGECIAAMCVVATQFWGRAVEVEGKIIFVFGKDAI